MLDLFHTIAPTYADIQVFKSIDNTNKFPPQQWVKPRGVSMTYMLAVGAGGDGGAGYVGAVNNAAGGGGGGSGGQSSLLIPSLFLPDVLSVIVPKGGSTGSTMIGIHGDYFNLFPRELILIANYGSAAGNGVGATAGIGGSGATASGITSNALAGIGKYNFLGGTAGSLGGSTGLGQNLGIQVTGSFTIGGCGGGGLPSGGSTGMGGGTYNGAGMLPAGTSSPGGSSATVPGGDGSGGLYPVPGLFFSYGGTGGGSSHGSATGSGLFGGNGGVGCHGSGGGGGGGCLTGGVAGLGGKGGDGLVVIISW